MSDLKRLKFWSNSEIIASTYHTLPSIEYLDLTNLTLFDNLECSE